MKEIYIYTLSDSKGDIRYVGKTANKTRKRLHAHINECKTNNVSHKINWIKSLLNKGETPIIETIDIVTKDDWEFWEQYWIQQFRAWGFNLTNISPGGYNNNYKRSNETKQKMRKSKLGCTLSEQHKKIISQSVKDKFKETPNYNKCCDKHIFISKEELYKKYIVENLSLNKCASYFNCSKKTIFKHITEYNFKKSKDDWKSQLSTREKKKVLQYDLNGSLIKEWSSLSELGSILNINKSNVANCCRGIAKTCVGYIWKYANNI